ncbi:MAG TPA: DUF373 family protein [Archaeoglobus veneficus]|nr:DUF373 family protein [Archaeoglobus veneficus]
MVKKIVLAIDRDNDLGRKAGVKSPVIGKDNNIDAAIKLGISDPEDSDVNTIFAAIKLYNELRSKGEDVEIVTICGDENVGVISDSKIAEQLDMIANELNAKSVVVVTDGSEDEFVLPVVSSRFKIDSVSRVIVKQSKTIESTYFLIKRMLNDPKIAKMTLAPLGIIFTVYSIFLLARYPEWGLGAIILALGFYFIIKAYGFEEIVESYFSNVKRSLLEGRFSFVTYMVSTILFILGIIQGFYAFYKLYSQLKTPGFIKLITSFIYGSVWWIVFAGISASIGKLFDLVLEGKPFKKYITVSCLLVSTGFILWGASTFVLAGEQVLELSIDAAFHYFALSIVAALIVGIIGVLPATKNYNLKDEFNKGLNKISNVKRVSIKKVLRIKNKLPPLNKRGE